MTYGLPMLPDGLTWSVQDYVGNYDDGVYAHKTRVTVGIRKREKFLFWNTNFRLAGVHVRIVDPALGEAAIRNAAQDIFAAYLALQVTQNN
jgi:hypothetical protein